MKYVVLLPIMAFAIGSVSHAAHAAHAGAPYTNVNHANDAGNPTGDSEVDKLNSMQLNQNYQGPTYAPGTPAPAATPMMPPNATTPEGRR